MKKCLDCNNLKRPLNLCKVHIFVVKDLTCDCKCKEWESIDSGIICEVCGENKLDRMCDCQKAQATDIDELYDKLARLTAWIDGCLFKDTPEFQKALNERFKLMDQIVGLSKSKAMFKAGQDDNEDR